MKLKNKNNNIVKEVDEVTGKLMLGTKDWEVYKEVPKNMYFSKKEKGIN